MLFGAREFYLHRKIAIFKENRWTYRVSWGSHCQTRCKIAILIEKPLFYTVFGSATPEIRDTFIDFRRKSRFYSMLSTAPPQIRDTFIDFLRESRFYTVFGAATPNLRDTFIDFLWKSWFYDVNKIPAHQKARVLRVFLLQFVECIAFFRVFRRESWNVSRFCLLFIGFLPFSKGILCKSMIVRSPAFLRLGLERPGLQKSSISFEFLLKIDDFRRRVDSEKPGVEKPSIFIRNPFGILKSIQRDFQRISMVFGSLASPSRPGVENPRFSKGI